MTPLDPATLGGPRWSVSGDTAHLVWGDGVILRARRQGKAWRVDWSGTYRTLAAAAAARGFPPVGHPIDDTPTPAPKATP